MIGTTRTTTDDGCTIVENLAWPLRYSVLATIAANPGTTAGRVAGSLAIYDAEMVFAIIDTHVARRRVSRTGFALTITAQGITWLPTAIRNAIIRTNRSNTTNTEVSR